MAEVAIYLINMDSESVRLEWMRKQLEKHELSYERISAVNGALLTPEDQAYHLSPLRSHLSRAEIGCLLSHTVAWETFLQSQADFALILEDDVHFADDFASFFEALPKFLDLSQPSIYRLEAFNARVTLKRRVVSKIRHRNCLQLLTNQGGAAAYILNRGAAEELLSAKHLLRHGADTEMFDPDRRAVTDLTIFQWLPAPCIQDMLHSSPIGLTSSLAGSRSDERSGFLKKTIPLVETLKSIGRPLYTFLYNLSLRPSGLTRRSSKFG